MVFKNQAHRLHLDIMTKTCDPSPTSRHKYVSYGSKSSAPWMWVVHLQAHKRKVTEVVNCHNIIIILLLIYNNG